MIQCFESFDGIFVCLAVFVDSYESGKEKNNRVELIARCEGDSFRLFVPQLAGQCDKRKETKKKNNLLDAKLQNKVGRKTRLQKSGIGDVCTDQTVRLVNSP